jgi:hypothetical protein
MIAPIASGWMAEMFEDLATFKILLLFALRSIQKREHYHPRAGLQIRPATNIESVVLLLCIPNATARLCHRMLRSCEPRYRNKLVLAKTGAPRKSTPRFA